MSGYVHLHRWRFWASAEGRRDEHVAWREGLCVADVIPRDMLGSPGLCVHVNGARVDSEQWFLRTLSPNDHVDVSIRPAGPGAGFLALVGPTGALTALGSGLVSVGISLVLSLLLPKPKGPKRRGDQESPTYAWDHKDNNRVEGQPRAVEYGELRFAPQVADWFVKTQTVPPVQYLYLLLYLGEGPIESIGGVTADNPPGTPLRASDPANPLPRGIEINSNPIENFRGIEAHVRLGTNNQEPIPGFEEIHTVSEVGSTLTSAETDAASGNAGTAWSSSFPYNSNDPLVQAVWTQYAQGFDLPDEADAATITINFPQGLYRIDSNGNVTDAYFEARVRYKQVHYLGLTVDSGGDNGDGWIYEPPRPLLAAHHQGAFTYEIPITFQSPAGYTPGTQGGILAADLAGMYAYTSLTDGGAPANIPNPWAAGQAIEEFTFEGWFKPVTLPFSLGGTTDPRPIFEWLSTGNYRGFSVMLERVYVDVGGSSPLQRWRLVTYFGDGTTTLRRFDEIGSGAGVWLGAINFPDPRWYHIALTYKRNASGTSARWSVYVDGVLKRTFLQAGQDLIAPAAPALLVATAGTPNGAVQGQGRMDETRFWHVEKSAAEIAAAYNFGAGMFGASATDARDLVAAWHFDTTDNLVNFSFASDYATSGSNTITTAGGAVIGDPTTQSDSILYRPGSGTPNRARRRVQVMRFNPKSTSAAIGDQSDWESIDGRIDEQLAYPNSAMLALKIPATEQLNTTQPTVTVVAKGRKVPVWDGVSTTAPVFEERWTPNPAWALYDMATNARYGRGGDFDSSSIDLVSFMEWAEHCDEKIYDGLGRTNIHETDTDQPIADILFDTTLNDLLGGLQIQFRLGFVPPPSWIVGGYLGFNDLPTSGGSIVLDINVENISGFAITDITFNGGSWLVTLAYDYATLGQPWADGSGIASASGASVVNGSVEGREERFRIDGIFDTFQKVWDAMLAVGRCGRAMPVIDGSHLRVRMSKPRSPVGIVGMGQIEPGSFKISYSSQRDRPNLYVTDFLDRDQDWRQKPAQRGDPTLEAGAPESAINRENIDLFGFTRRSGVLREMDFQLAVNRTLVRQGEYVTGIEALFYEVGDVVTLAHDLVPWGRSSRFPAACTGTTIVLDRTITLEADTTYFVQTTHNAAGQVGSGSSVSDYKETRQITSVAGTYAAGNSITIASAFTVDPAKDDPWLVYSESQQFLAEIAEITLDEKRKRKVTWVQYSDSVYDVDTLSSDIPQGQQFALTTPPSVAAQAPGPVSLVDLREGQRSSPDGTWHPEIQLAWQLEADTQLHVREVVIWTRALGANPSPWDVAIRLSGPASSARFRALVDTPGTQLEVAIQPVSSEGARLQPESCARALITIEGVYVAPPAPTNLTAVMDGDQVTYRWTPPANSRGLSFELRRGGWCVGQVLAVAPPGSTSIGPTRDWASAKNNVHGDGPPILVLRSRDARGQYSSACTLTGFDPSVPGTRVLTSGVVSGKMTSVGNVRFEDWGVGWVSSPPLVSDPPMTNVEVATIPDGRKILQLASPFLSGTYQTPANTISSTSRAEYVYVEAFAVADQVPPITLADITLGLDDPRAARRSLEGLIDTTACTLIIEWCFRVNPTDAYSPWQSFKPGRYFILDALFRITLTRPDTTWQVRVYSFGTRLSRIAPQRFQKTAVRAAIESSLATIG